MKQWESSCLQGNNLDNFCISRDIIPTFNIYVEAIIEEFFVASEIKIFIFRILIRLYFPNSKQFKWEICVLSYMRRHHWPPAQYTFSFHFSLMFTIISLDQKCLTPIKKKTCAKSSLIRALGSPLICRLFWPFTLWTGFRNS